MLEAARVKPRLAPGRDARRAELGAGSELIRQLQPPGAGTDRWRCCLPSAARVPTEEPRWRHARGCRRNPRASTTARRFLQRHASHESYGIAMDKKRRMLFEPTKPVHPTSTGCSARETATSNQVEVPASLTPLDGKIRQVLAKDSRSPEEIARAIGESVDAVRRALRRLSRAGHVYNLGTKEYRIYTWRIGNNSSSAELRDEVLRLIQGSMTRRELQAATGADLARVARALCQLHRDPKSRNRIRKLGDGPNALWLPKPNPWRVDGPRPRRQRLGRLRRTLTQARCLSMAARPNW